MALLDYIQFIIHFINRLVERAAPSREYIAQPIWNVAVNGFWAVGVKPWGVVIGALQPNKVVAGGTAKFAACKFVQW